MKEKAKRPGDVIIEQIKLWAANRPDRLKHIKDCLECHYRGKTIDRLSMKEIIELRDQCGIKF